MKFKIILFVLLFIICFGNINAYTAPSISSKAAVAIDADSSTVLYNKNMNQKIFPASTTKILTAILAIENLTLEENAIVSKTAINIPWDSSSVYLQEGEIISINDLLYCLLLNSGNDAANVLAEAVSGSIPSFVELMNAKIKEIGCTNTHFNNAHGYSDSNHFTTALDMAKILNYCIKNETFVKIMSTKSYIVEATNKTNTKRYLSNTNRLIQQKEDNVHARYYEYCIGGKTGYTDESGRTLVTFGKKDNKTIIVTIFGAHTGGSVDVRYTDAINLFEYSFNNFNKITIAEADNYNFNYINTDKNLNYSIGLKDNLEIMLPLNTKPNITYTIDINENSIKNFDTTNYSQVAVGTITFSLTNFNTPNSSYAKTLYLKSVIKYNNENIIYCLIPIVLLLVILTTILVVLKNIKTKPTKNNKSRKARRIN